MDRARAAVQLMSEFDTDFCGMALDVRDALPDLALFLMNWAYGMVVAIFQSALRCWGYTRSQLPKGDATPDGAAEPLTQAAKGPAVHPSRIEMTWDGVISNVSAKLMPARFRYAATRVPDA